MVLLSWRTRWDRLPVAWRRGVLVALVLRLALAVLAVVAGGLLPGLDPVDVAGVPGTGFRGWSGSTPAEQGVGLLGAGLERFDALWFLAIAADGYPTGTGSVPQAAAFFPGYPLAVGLVGRVLAGAYLLAANLVSLAATAAALAGVHRLAERFPLPRDHAGSAPGPDDTPRRALLFLAVFPTSFFLLAPYSESLFLAASTWALVAARERRWALAAATALVAGLTRNVGVLLVVPLAIEAWTACRGQDRTTPAGWIGAVVAAPAGAALYLAAGWRWWGVPLAPLQVQTGWQREPTWPWETLAEAVRLGLGSAGLYASGYHTADLLVVLPVLAAVAWLLARGPASLAWYGLAHAVVWLVLPFPARPLMSVPRLALAVAPVFLAFAAWTRRGAVERGWVAVSAALLGVHALLYVSWYYVF
ncbi:MAG: hypothetical protein KY457_01220 [Actinobacteria bacterium]|nr:hypothetical protein [Actinomycetota bacterium]